MLKSDCPMLYEVSQAVLERQEVVAYLRGGSGGRSWMSSSGGSI